MILASTCTATVLSIARVDGSTGDERLLGEYDAPRYIYGNELRQVNIDVSVTGENGKAEPGAMVSIRSLLSQYKSPKDVVESPPRSSGDLDFIFIGRTDDSGWLTTTVELPRYVTMVHVEVKTATQDYYREVTIVGNDTISANF